jgi:hypothetical protein
MAETALSLPLFMARITTHHVNHPAAAYDFAMLTDSADAGTYFHDLLNSNINILSIYVAKHSSIRGFVVFMQGPASREKLMFYFI